MRLGIIFAIAAALFAVPSVDPYSALTQKERDILKPGIERWIRDQVKHDWADLWEIQDQTSELKNVILLGQRDAPDMSRAQYVGAMRDTIGTGYPEIKAFTLREIRKEDGGFWILGCGKQQREEWKQTSITDVHARIVDGKIRFGLPGGSPEECKL
jgi:hypothetical protein